MRVLVIDDHSLFRDGIVSLLTAAGYQVVGEGGTGEQAIALTAELRPDVVLMDINMPELDGISALRHIKERYPRTKVVMLTVSDDDAHLFAWNSARIGEPRRYKRLFLKKNAQEQWSEVPDARHSLRMLHRVLYESRDRDPVRIDAAALKLRNECLAGYRYLVKTVVPVHDEGPLRPEIAQGLREDEAYALLRKTSMNKRAPMKDIAEAIILSSEIRNA